MPTFRLSAPSGFEIDAPLAQKGFGNRPGVWDVFTDAHKDRMFWKWEFERYWLFYRFGDGSATIRRRRKACGWANSRGASAAAAKT